MKRERYQGVAWYLGTIQYCTCLFAGGGLWFALARLTGFFNGDLYWQISACLVLLVIITGESLWAFMPGFGNPFTEFMIDFLTSAAIAGFGMVVVLFILLWLRQ